MFLNTTFRAFRHRDYLIYWLGLFLGHTGTLVQTTAQTWLIFQLTDSPFYLGLEGLCLGLPRVLFSAFGGAVVDRGDRKIIFALTQSSFVAMALFLGLMQHLGLIQVWHLLLVSALTGVLVSFEQPVRQSILHHLVPRDDLPNAVTLYQMVFNGSMLFGPSVGGLLIPIIDTKGCFFLATAGNLFVGDYISHPHTGRGPSVGQNQHYARHDRRPQTGLEHAGVSSAVYGPRGRQLLHQTIYPVHAGVCANYSQCRGARSRHVVDGTGRRGDPGRSDTRFAT